MCCFFILFAVFGPRFAIVAMWLFGNRVDAAFGSWVWPLLGLLFFPWTTLIYGFVAPNGLSLLNIIFLASAFLIDLATWGVGFLATREQTSNYRGT